ncbi:MAG TPA: hypothetical protein VLA83_10550, partial [Candidatus Binatia bacterium]|nr:hypothetical protein [Candidatus Binatia bacterium]
MQKLKNLLRPSLVVFTLAACAAAAGCGGSTATSSSTTANGANPAPSPGASPTPTSGTPSSAQIIPDIQKLTGWQTCVLSCAGAPAAVFSMTQKIASPSLSGSSTRFSLLSGTSSFGAVMWFNALGAHNNATHFLFDLNFYVDNPGAAQALEFYVSQSAGGARYNFGTQCDLAGGHAWRMWDNIGKKWVASAATCPAPAANTWNHLVFEFQRQTGGNVIFTAVTVNGKRSLVNLSMQHTADSGSGLDVAYQSDANGSGTPYSVWLDKVSLT